MNANIGELLVASYLKHIKQCDFTQTNTLTTEAQGEIDVIGMQLESRTIYVCEVAIHLVTGLLYTKNGKNVNIEKLTQKFKNDVEYMDRYFPEYRKIYMLWSPIIKDSRGKIENSQLEQVKEVQRIVKTRHGIDLQVVANSNFQSCIDEMREFASRQTADSSCPIIRVMQIEEYIKKNAQRERNK